MKLNRYIAGLMLVGCIAACNERGAEKDTDGVNKTDTRRNTEGTTNYLTNDSSDKRSDTAQHGGPDEPPQ